MPTAASSPGRAPRCRRAVFLAQLAALAACADSRSATDVTGPSGDPMRFGMSADVVSTATNGKIAFVSGRDGNSEIYIMEPDGSGQTRLTNYEETDDTPAWSPDGTKLAFRRYVPRADGGFQTDIYVMNALSRELSTRTRISTS